MKKIILALAAVASLAGGASAAAPKPVEYGKEASIPFVNHGGIRDFRTVGRDTIYLQDQQRRWYRGTFMGPCIELPWANAIGVSSRGTSSLDKFGTLIVRGDRCPLRVAGPGRSPAAEA